MFLAGFFFVKKQEKVLDKAIQKRVDFANRAVYSTGIRVCGKRDPSDIWQNARGRKAAGIREGEGQDAVSAKRTGVLPVSNSESWNSQGNGLREREPEAVMYRSDGTLNAERTIGASFGHAGRRDQTNPDKKSGRHRFYR